MFNLKTISLFALTMAVMLTAPASAQQTVNPSGACAVDSRTSIIEAQSGQYYCYPSALGSATGTWTQVRLGVNSVSYTIAYNNTGLIGTAGLTKDISVITLPAGAKVLVAQLTTTTTWAGPATLTASIGDSSSTTAFTAAQNLFTAASATTFVMNTAPKITTTAADTSLVRFTATTNNLTTLTAGALRVDVTYVLAAPSATAITALLEYPVMNRSLGLPERRTLVAFDKRQYWRV